MFEELPNPIEELNALKGRLTFLPADRYKELVANVDKIMDGFTKSTGTVLQQIKDAGVEQQLGTIDTAGDTAKTLGEAPVKEAMGHAAELARFLQRISATAGTAEWKKGIDFTRFGLPKEGKSVAHWSPANRDAFSDWAMASISMSLHELADPDAKLTHVHGAKVDLCADAVPCDHAAAEPAKPPVPDPALHSESNVASFLAPKKPAKPANEPKVGDDSLGWQAWLDGEWSRSGGRKPK